MWTDFSSRLIDTTKSTLGLTRGNKSYKKLWWWNEKVQTTIQEKKALYKIWYKSKNPDDKTNYKKTKRIATKAVARAKVMANNDMYEELNTKEGQNKIYRLAKKQRWVDNKGKRNNE
ncbi:uncharacterized protein LOC135924211 [Gordionus sp. m RMFG-2023]|uniref:uncharacterized protein LOC135924211 n=1 Tax=Gordionus sp. m RMFG-2023 TaxID=3053472 RepID=UPI0031FC7D01